MTARKTTSERQTEIADTALRIIATRGIASLKVASLAQELGLSGGALYRHFDSTEAILDAVAARAVELLQASLPSADLPPLEWLERFVRARSETVAGHLGLARLCFSDQLAHALPESASERLRGAVVATRAAIARALVEAQKRGEVRGDLAAADMALVVMGTVQVLVRQRSGAGAPRGADPARAWATLRALLAPTVGGTR